MVARDRRRPLTAGPAGLDSTDAPAPGPARPRSAPRRRQRPDGRAPDPRGRVLARACPGFPTARRHGTRAAGPSVGAGPRRRNRAAPACRGPARPAHRPRPPALHAIGRRPCRRPSKMHHGDPGVCTASPDGNLPPGACASSSTELVRTRFAAAARHPGRPGPDPCIVVHDAGVRDRPGPGGVGGADPVQSRASMRRPYRTPAASCRTRSRVWRSRGLCA